MSPLNNITAGVLVAASLSFATPGAAADDECMLATPAVEERLVGKSYGFRRYTLEQRGNSMKESAVTADGQRFEVQHEGCDVARTTVRVLLRGKEYDAAKAKRYFGRALKFLKAQSWTESGDGPTMPIRYILADLTAALGKAEMTDTFEAGDEMYSVSGSARRSDRKGIAIEVTLVYSVHGAL